MLAAATNQKEILNILILTGKSDFSIKDKDGFTAFDHAEMENHQNILELKLERKEEEAVFFS